MYEFKEQDAYDFARHIHAQTREHNGELFFRLCPYCNPKPSRGNLNTFSINLKTGQFKCLRSSCGVSGNMLTLSKDFDFSLGLRQTLILVWGEFNGLLLLCGCITIFSVPKDLY